MLQMVSGSIDGVGFLGGKMFWQNISSGAGLQIMVIVQEVSFLRLQQQIVFDATASGRLICQVQWR